MNIAFKPEPGSGSLPTRITGIVFWGTLFVGFLIALFILNGRERELKQLQENDANLIEHNIEILLEQHATLPLLQTSQQQLNASLQAMQQQIRFEAIQLASEGESLQFGMTDPGQGIVTRNFNIAEPDGSKTRHPVTLSIHFTSLEKSYAQYRRQIILVIGIIVVIYALILQIILKVLLSRPFSEMVNTAIRVTEGDTNTRFDENQQNEFGFLSRFINRALNSIVAHENQLQEALDRATQSEAALFKEKESAEVTLKSIADAVITTNESGLVQYLNPVAERITGWSNADARGQPLSDIISIVQESSGKSIFNPVYQCIENNGVETLTTHASLIRRDGEAVAIEASAAPMRNDQGRVIGAVMVCQDVTQARKFAYQLSFQARHDALTGLFNRREFDHKLAELLEDVRLQGNHNILLYLDLDQFKIVNDTCGHAAGDKLLLQLSVLLGQKVRKNDILARLGGDEFGVLLYGCDIECGKKIADALLNVISEFRFVWEDKIFQVGVSIGMVPVTAATENAAEAMSAADAACYMAKDKGRNRIEICSGDGARGKHYGEMQWVPRIHKAMEEARLHLYRQNLINLNPDEEVEYAEILLRMEDEDGNMIPPMAFIPAAERYNLMPTIDRWVIRHTLEWLQAYPCGSSGKPQHFAINISGQSLGDEQFLPFLLAQLESTGISPSRLCIEITETTAIANIGNALSFITALKAKGSKFALDDFGSGMSSYSYLKTLNVNSVKIDGSFIRDLMNSPVDIAMVESINKIGHVMGLQTIAEFVESEAALNKLRDIGINYAQGYYIHQPEPLYGSEPQSVKLKTAA